ALQQRPETRHRCPRVPDWNWACRRGSDGHRGGTPAKDNFFCRPPLFSRAVTHSSVCRKPKRAGYLVSFLEEGRGPGSRNRKRRRELRALFERPLPPEPPP